MSFDSKQYAYPSRRNVCYGANGMCATGNPYAAHAGLDIMKQGGNAIDAAVAMAMCLSVTEPSANGIGGDAFAIIYTNGQLYGLNASGWSPKNLSMQKLSDKGLTEIPTYGFEAVTIPGIPSAWAALNQRFGKLPLTKIVEPAATYAEEGFPVAVGVVGGWKRTYANFLEKCNDEAHKNWFDMFSKDGEIPRAGDVWRYKYMGKTLREIAATKAESFYHGDLMESIVKFSNENGGYFDKSDFMAYKPEWVNPVSTNYKGYDVFELPPNGHGITALMALNILENFQLDNHRETARNYHLQMEAMKLAFTDGAKYIADEKFMNVKVSDMLSKDYAKQRSKLINENTAGIFSHGQFDSSGTVYLCAADKDGNMISYIQSNYMGFGSGLVVPGTNIALHNRGHNFTMEENHVNQIGPRKRPYNTIIPGFMMKDNVAIGPFGVMGGFMQPQGHMQMVINTVDFHMNPQDALDATRWQWMKGKNVDVESSIHPAIAQSLSDRGHDVKMLHNYGSMGRGQIIWREENGILCGGTEPRTDGTIGMW